MHCGWAHFAGLVMRAKCNGCPVTRRNACLVTQHEHKTRGRRLSNTQNWNGNRTHDFVAMRPEAAAVGIAASHEQVGVRVFCSLAQHCRNVATADEYVGLDPGIFLKICNLLSRVTDRRLFPFGIEVSAARSPTFDARSNVSELQARAKFGS